MAARPATDVLAFWFSEGVRPLWFNATPEFDRRIHDQFLETYEAAARGELREWTETGAGALALVILLDQFPLNMFRGDRRSFAAEAAARAVASQAIERGLDRDLDDAGKAFLYMPFMHSEALSDQDRSLALYERAGLAENLKFARHHRDIVRRFGRFRHRNAILARESTPDECAYLASPEAFRG